MTGIELALAIVPLVIAVVEHHQTVLRRAQAITSSRAKNEQQIEFYQDLYAELALLETVLNGVKAYSTQKNPNNNASQERRASQNLSDVIHEALGNSAEPFEQILGRVLKGVDALVRDKSVALTGQDAVSSRPEI
jgi:hypothetical protein